MGDNFIPATRPLRDCATWYSGGTPNKSTPGFWNGSIPWISAKSLNTFFVQDSEDRVTDEGARNGTRLVPTDSILFVVRGMSLKSEFRMGIARRPVTFNQDLKALVAANDIVPAYLAYAIRAKTTEILGMVGEAGHGTGVLPTDRIQALEVRTPPLPEQRAIAHILGTLDDKIELNRRTNETLEAMARALFKSWFVDFDPVHAKKAGRKPEGMDAETAALFPDDFEDSEMGKIPRGWRVAPVTTMQDGGKYACTAGPFGSNLTSRDYVDFGIPVIRGGNLSGPSLWLTNDAFVFVSLEKARQLSSNTAHPGDVIFTQRGTLGQVAIIPPDGQAEYILSQSQMKLRVDALTSSPFYVALYFRQERVIDQIVANGQQAGVPHVNLGFLRKFPTLIPDSRVLRSFDAIVRVTYSGVLRKLRESATLSALRDALLPQLLSGSLRVPEAMRLVEKVI